VTTMTELLIGIIILGMVGIIALIVRSYRSDIKASQVTPAGSLPSHHHGQAVSHTAPKPADHHKATADAHPAPPPLAGLDSATLERMAQAAFEQAVTEATGEFKQQVQGSSQRLSDLAVRLTTKVVEEELEVYRTELALARDAAIKSLKEMQVAIEAKQQELEKGIDHEIVERKKHLLERLDAHLGTAVAAYIVESLGQGVDLGAQKSYLFDSLERHKVELRKDLSDEL
jgi:hypothetical protein